MTSHIYHTARIILPIMLGAAICSAADAQQMHLLYNSHEAPLIYRFDAQTGAGDGIFALDPELLNDGGDGVIGPHDGHLYITLPGLDRISMYESVCGSGERIGTFAGGEPGSGGGTQPGQYLDSPISLDFGADGNLYVVSGHNYSIVKYHGISGGTVPLATCAMGISINPLRIRKGPDGMLYFWFISNLRG